MNQEKLFSFLFILLLSITGSISGLDEELINVCGGDEELIIGCVGDEELFFSGNIPEVEAGEPSGGGGLPQQIVPSTVIKEEEVEGDSFLSKNIIYIIFALIIAFIIFVLIMILIICDKRRKRKT